MLQLYKIRIDFIIFINDIKKYHEKLKFDTITDKKDIFFIYLHLLHFFVYLEI